MQYWALNPPSQTDEVQTTFVAIARARHVTFFFSDLSRPSRLASGELATMQTELDMF